MTYNLHPIFVHFPIAFLLLYSIIKLLPFERWFPKTSWKQTYKILLVFGVIGSYVAMSTGEVAEDLLQPDKDLVGMHELFAGITTNLYLLLLIGELFPNIQKLIAKIKIVPSIITKIIAWIEKIITHTFIVKLLALAGAIMLFLTGLLGGVLTHGVTADPIAPFVLRVLGL